MDTNKDDMKGRIKEAIGDLTDNKDLRREGKRDQAGAKVKDAAQKMKDKIDDTVDAAKAKFDKK